MACSRSMKTMLSRRLAGIFSVELVSVELPSDRRERRILYGESGKLVDCRGLLILKCHSIRNDGERVFSGVSCELHYFKHADSQKGTDNNGVVARKKSYSEMSMAKLTNNSTPLHTTAPSPFHCCCTCWCAASLSFIVRLSRFD